MVLSAARWWSSATAGDPAGPEGGYTRRLVRERVAGHRFVEGSDGGAPLLAIEHVSADYPGKPKVIDDVSIEVRRGDTVAVVGKSGSGKSTLARVVTGLLSRTSGDVRFNGVSLPPPCKAGPRTSCGGCR